MTFKVLRIFAASALIAGLGLTIPTHKAHAAVCQFGTAADFTATADVSTSTACEGQISGNDSEGALNGFGTSGMFGISNWDLDSKYDQDTSSYSPTGLLAVSNLTSDLFQGDWDVSSWSSIGAAVLVIKGGNGFAAYLLDINAGLSGQWSTQALTNGGGKQPGISHVSLYVSLAAVPLPATGFLMIGALGGLGLLRRRRKAAA